MGYKYNSKQRMVARKIHELRRKQRILRKEWLDIDTKINYLNLKYLEGKYNKTKKEYEKEF